MKLIGHAQEIGQRIIDAFKKPESLPAALAPIFINRKDDIPCRKWSWHNQVVAALCGTTDARGFKQWDVVKRKVKKGSKAIWILAPCIKSTKETDLTGEEIEHKALLGFKGIPVFAYEDTEGEPLVTGDDKYDNWVLELPLMEVAKAWGITVGAYSGNNNAPLGYFQRRNESQAIMLGVENLSTWAHEMIHAADSRLLKQHDKAHKEIIAEFGGAVLLQCLGMHHDSDLGGAYQYCETYARDTKKDLIKVCIELLDRVCDCVKLILDEAKKQTILA